MKRWLVILALCVTAWAQAGSPSSEPPAESKTFDSITFPVFSLNPVPIPGASIALVGAPGQATWYFWASANFQLGSVISFLGSISNAPNTLTSGNYVSIIPNTYPAGILTADILATQTPIVPTGACNCAVATGLTSGGANFQSNTLSSYTVSILNPQAYGLVLRNEVTGTGATSLMLRNAYTGALVCNVSTGCGGGSNPNPTLATITGTDTSGFGLTAVKTIPATGDNDFQFATPSGDEFILGDVFNTIASSDVCTLGPYAVGASSGGITCIGANGSRLMLDTQGISSATGIKMSAGSGGEILFQAGANDSQQLPGGWYSSNVMSSNQHALSTRCESAGTSANPSVVTCNTVGAQGGGAFSCAVAASGGTCVINDSVVCVGSGAGCSSLTTTSTIAVWQVADEGTILSVTCNTNPVPFMLASRTTGVGFTLTMGTFSVNPACFNFLIH